MPLKHKLSWNKILIWPILVAASVHRHSGQNSGALLTPSLFLNSQSTLQPPSWLYIQNLFRSWALSSTLSPLPTPITLLILIQWLFSHTWILSKPLTSSQLPPALKLGNTEKNMHLPFCFHIQQKLSYRYIEKHNVSDRYTGKVSHRHAVKIQMTYASGFSLWCTL